jgi:TPR repeat protein
MKWAVYVLTGCTFFLPLNSYSATYKYVHNGTVCFTDDLGNVPAKLRKEAVNIEDVGGETAATSISSGNKGDAQAGDRSELGMAELEKAARSGDVRVQNEVGKRYVTGNGVPRDDEKARYWFTLCAKAGDMLCQSNIASMIMTGRGGGQSFAEGIRWLKAAADQGDAQSQYNLGREYETGGKVKVNIGEAVKFYQMAADQGFEEAQVNLGGMYMRGEGVERNLAKARELFEKAARAGNSVAQQNLSLLNGTTTLQRH